MEVIDDEVFVLMVGVLAFGSSLIHYAAYAKDRAKVVIRYNKK